MNRKELKEKARLALDNGIFKQAWMMGLLVCLVTTVITGIAGSILPGLGSLIIIGPLFGGVVHVFVELCRNKKPIEIKDLFYGFSSDFGEYFLLGLLKTIFIALWSLLLIVPGIIKQFSYAMSYYIKNDHPDYDWRKCLDESQRMMKGHKWELFVLDLSFIGWYIVGALVLGVGILWVEPYKEATITEFYLKLKESEVEVIE